MRVLAIDPGTTESALVMFDGTRVCSHDKLDNADMLYVLGTVGPHNLANCELVIEKVACMGMAIGESTMETIFWSGRFAQAWGRPFHRIPRIDVKLHLCGGARAKDSNVRQALIDRLGPPGCKAKPGPTYGITADKWAALAVAVTWYDQQKSVRRTEQESCNSYTA